MKITIDLTNLMEIDFVTGIQRVVIETVLAFLEKTDAINLLIYNTPKKSYYKLDNEKFVEFYRDGLGAKKDIVTEVPFFFEEVGPTDVLYTFDSVWNNPHDAAYVFENWRRQGGKVATFVHDIIPVMFPQYCYEMSAYRFIKFFVATIKYSDIIIVSAEVTKKHIIETARKAGYENLDIRVVPLGSDFRGEEEESSKRGKIEDYVTEAIGKIKGRGEEYILSVGTIEPRKNHKLLLDALDDPEFQKLNINLVFIGRIGWEIKEIEERIMKHPLLGKKLFYLNRVSDEALQYVYDGAYALAFPSFYEGFGLPVVEALSKKIPVLSSNVDIMEEIGGGYTKMFDPNSKEEFIETVKTNLADKDNYRLWKEKVDSYKPVTWEKVAVDKLHEIHSILGENPDEKIEIKQVLLLTARADTAINTVEYIENLIPFIEEIVYICPEEIVDEIKKNQNSKKLKFTFITDEELSKGEQLPKDHVKRNFFLRAEAIKHPAVEEYFIMYDDDYRPLFKINESDFIKNNRIKAHYFYSLKKWEGCVNDLTSFDIGAQKSLEILEEWNCSSLQFSSHMPQAMSKKVWLSLLEKLPENYSDLGIEEWSMYYNYGFKFFPYLFCKEKFTTLCWPGLPSDWDLDVIPKEYLWENYYEEFYEDGEIFAGYPRSFTNYEEHVRKSTEKIAIRSEISNDFEKFLNTRQAAAGVYELEKGAAPAIRMLIDDQDIIVPDYLMFSRSMLDGRKHFARISIPIISEKTFSRRAIRVGYKIVRPNKPETILDENEFTLSKENANSILISIGSPFETGLFDLVLIFRIKGRRIARQIPLYVI